MTNVVPISSAKEPPPIDHLRVLSALKRLYLARVLSTDALFLGTQIVQLMAEHDTDTVAITHKQASSSFVVARGQILAGRVTDNVEEFTVALQQLHYYAYLQSALTSSVFDAEDNCHFTQDASVMSPAFAWGTPIHFAFDPARTEDLENFAFAETEAALSVATRKELTLPAGR